MGGMSADLGATQPLCRVRLQHGQCMTVWAIARLEGGPAGLRRAFQYFDRDGSGGVSMQEFKDGLKAHCMLEFDGEAAVAACNLSQRSNDRQGQTAAQPREQGKRDSTQSSRSESRRKSARAARYVFAAPPVGSFEGSFCGHTRVYGRRDRAQIAMGVMLTV